MVKGKAKTVKKYGCGGKVKKYSHGGRVRGAGACTRGMRPAKMS